ncbi:DUF6443 domain-containing protein [Flavivirga jejuensis]|uniref:DUF6443 domain-containing protein n=1 Tax=Flavivirga jejuensis TaxID=870487 RepID=A0ABT8WPD8_9FLAO|nr:DUF6443 domain-containing protein [Flavivirga jejuensis]MDO5975015.1 DUF6443 domain-containing protein [Flavivirga jejuensis]
MATTSKHHNKYHIKTIGFILMCVICSSLYAQTYTIDGPEALIMNQPDTYTFKNSYSDNVPSGYYYWSTADGIILDSQDYYNYYEAYNHTEIQVQWGTEGIKTLEVSIQGVTYEVTVIVYGNTPPPTPPTPKVYQNKCGYTTLGFAENQYAPAGITWYWQNTSSGTSTSNSSKYIDKESGTIQYLRARSISGKWSDSSSSVSYTVNQSSTWYADTDGDGLGDPNTSDEFCSQQPLGYVSNNLDQCPDEAGTSANNGCPSTSSTFESGLGDWTQATNDHIDWTIKSGSTSSSGTGPTSAIQGSYYIYVEASSPNYPSKTATITSRPYTVESNGTFTFNYHMYGSYMGSLTLYASINGGSTWQSIWSLSGNQGNSWKTAIVDLSGYSNSNLTFKFTGITGNSDQSDMSIDNIKISSEPSEPSEPVGCTASLTDENYVYTLTPLEATNDASSLSQDDMIEAVQYFDGLGRPMQSVGIRAGGNKEDIITHIGYDDLGRQDKEYLPYTTSSSCGSFQTGAEQATKDYYYNATRFADDFAGLTQTTINPYSEKHLEASPLGRVLEQAAPGADWALNKGSDADHTIKFEYNTNLDEDHVRVFSVNTTFSDGIYKPTLVDNGTTYKAGELYKTVTKDENWILWRSLTDHTIEEYKNKQGQVILKRTFINQKWHDTYYVYDDFGNLTFVLPPMINTISSLTQYFEDNEYNGQGYGECSDLIVSFSSWCTSFELFLYLGSDIHIDIELSPTPEFIKLETGKVLDLDLPSDFPDMNLGDILYDYREVLGTAYIQNKGLYFNSNGRTIYTGNGEWISMNANLDSLQSAFTPEPITQNDLDGLGYQYKYDYKNRLVEKKIPGKDWEYIVYNKLDQPILTQDANLQANNEWLFTKYDVFGRVAYTGIFSNGSSRIDLQALADGTSLQYVTKSDSPVTIAGTAVYYDNGAYPVVAATDEVYTINYYDNYEVGNQITFNPANGSGTWEGMSASIKVKGLPTVSRVKVLETSDWITSATYYDEKGRAWEYYVKNDYLDTEEWILNKLDFTGAIDKTLTMHTKNGITISIENVFTYDHVGRLVSQKQKINNQAEELITLNSYDALGQLENKKVGGDVASAIENSTGLQTVDYTYNIRGWLKGINNTGGSNASIGLGTDDLFGFQINYNNPNTGSSLFNGNISQTLWETASINTGSTETTQYTYSYDVLNRITGALSNNTTNYNLGLVDYDKNGNIMHLERNGHRDANITTFGLMDDLTYSYDGNQLKAVDDSASASAVTGFIDGAESAEEYTYDSNGNMLTDLNKGISTNIVYNYLNLPTQVTLASGNISYIYDATGVKQKKIVSTGTNTLYAGNYVYEGASGNESLKFFNHPEGYVDVDNGAYEYVYQYKDHLGNVRLSYKDNNGTLEILEENNYYPFGLRHKGYNTNVTSTNIALKRKFGGMEYQDELGLNWYDITARNYDPALGRWMNLDPLASEMPEWSPYNFVFNNPLRFIDPLGLAPDDIIFNSIDENGNKIELGRIVTDAFDQEINIDQNVLPFDVPENFEPVTVDLDGNEMVSNALESTGIQAFSLDVSGEAAFKVGMQLEVSLIGIVAGENKGDWGVTLQGNGLVGLEGSVTGSASAYWSLNGQDLSLGNLRGLEYGAQGSVFGVAGSYFEGFGFTSSYPFVERVYGGASLGGSLGIPELGGSGSGYIGVSEFIYRSDKK